MDADTRARFEMRAQIVKALAHPTRLFIVEELSKHEYCVCELTEMIGADTSTVSKHLSILKQAGIVKDDKRGTTVYYQLRCPCILNFFGCIEDVMQTTMQERTRLLSR
ncbi:transcriptional regulator, ArsR family [Candidatus Moduliflexus flocculans]|uniref:Transcriptional regulator, ArsR family n=1 Tax=Candidatus Moduliflexus flocculans TaxID=1499966 RepID=A0A081BSS3_9BACT|nr:transcriptional regulator, ArsR family [Candidatus Moduliflexus flocculans]